MYICSKIKTKKEMGDLKIEHLGRRLSSGLEFDISHTEYGQSEKQRLKSCKLIGFNKDVLLLQTNIRSQNDGFLCLDKSTPKPIYHPLSDLTKPIWYNGEKFVPIEKMVEGTDLIFIKKHGDLYLFKNKKSIILSSLPVNEIENWEYKYIQKLIKYRFVIDEPEGAWIDVNTLDVNPYK